MSQTHATADRQAGGASVPGDRLPRPPRRRRAGMVSSAVLLIVGGAAAAGLLALRLDSRAPVVVASAHIAAGQKITAEALSTTPVAGEGLNLIPADQLQQVVGRYASTDIPAGRLLDAQMISESGLLKQGRAAVGVVLKAGRAPATGLQSGDVVQVVRAVDGVPEVLTSNASVSKVSEPRSGTFDAGGDAVATIVVDVADAPKIAAAVVADQVVIVLLSRAGGS